MSIECGVCERDARGDHANWCPMPDFRQLQRENQRYREALESISRSRLGVRGWTRWALRMKRRATTALNTKDTT